MSPRYLLLLLLVLNLHLEGRLQYVADYGGLRLFPRVHVHLIIVVAELACPQLLTLCLSDCAVHIENTFAISTLDGVTSRNLIGGIFKTTH